MNAVKFIGTGINCRLPENSGGWRRHFKIKKFTAFAICNILQSNFLIFFTLFSLWNFLLPLRSLVSAQLGICCFNFQQSHYYPFSLTDAKKKKKKVIKSRRNHPDSLTPPWTSPRDCFLVLWFTIFEIFDSGTRLQLRQKRSPRQIAWHFILSVLTFLSTTEG